MYQHIEHIGLPVTNYGVIHNGWRDGVLVQALSWLPRGVLGPLQHKVLQRWAGSSWGNRTQQGSFCETPQGKQEVFLCEGDTANSPDEVPLHKRTRHGKQIGRAGSYCAARKLWSDCPYWKYMWWIPWLKCGYWWLQTVQTGRVGKEGLRCCPLHQEINTIWRVVPEE